MKLFSKIRFFIFIIFSIFILDRASASIFGEENVILSKILIEDIKHTLNLENLVKAGANEIKKLNQKYLFDKWINKGLDQVKDFGLLSELKADDYILGSLQRDLGNLGIKYQGKEFRFENINDWVDQVWNLAPTENDDTFPLRDKVARKSAETALEDYLWNLEYNQKIKQRYFDIQNSATKANPGLASRITAQTNALQTYQLANISDTQNRIMQLMAIKRLEKIQREKQTKSYFQNSFSGLKSIYQDLAGNE